MKIQLLLFLVRQGCLGLYKNQRGGNGRRPCVLSSAIKRVKTGRTFSLPKKMPDLHWQSRWRTTALKFLLITSLSTPHNPALKSFDGLYWHLKKKSLCAQSSLLGHLFYLVTWSIYMGQYGHQDCPWFCWQYTFIYFWPDWYASVVYIPAAFNRCSLYTTCYRFISLDGLVLPFSTTSFSADLTVLLMLTTTRNLVRLTVVIWNNLFDVFILLYL